MKKFVLLFFMIFGICLADDLNQSLNLENLSTNSKLTSQSNSQNASEILKNDLNLSQNVTSPSYEKTTNLDKKADFTLYSLYENADIVVKGVIYILVVFSLLTWAIFFAKLILFWRYKRVLELDFLHVKKAIFLDDLPILGEKSFIEIFKNEAVTEIKKSQNLSGTKSRIKTNFEIKINSIITEARNLTSILASIGSSAPFIGLFGTVWGIMNSFIGIASSNDTGLDVVAPGIAEALFATAFGLAAAIPAVLFYNYITRKTAKFSNELDEVATAVYLVADRTLDRKW